MWSAVGIGASKAFVAPLHVSDFSTASPRGMKWLYFLLEATFFDIHSPG